MRIFLSYGHGDYDEFVDRLSRDLVALDDVEQVWVDRMLMVGDAYTSVIDKAIDSCDFFLFVNSSQSTRPESYCGGEVQRACDQQRKIVPVCVDDTPVPTIISGRQRVFMTDSITDSGAVNEEAYAYEFRALVESLRQAYGSCNISNFKGTCATLSDFDKSMYDEDLFELRLVERGMPSESVLSEIDGWLHGSGRYLCIVGNPGSGKSTLSAAIHTLNKERCVIHYLRHDDESSLDAKAVVQHLMYELVQISPRFEQTVRDLVDFEQLSVSSSTASLLKDTLLKTPMRKTIFEEEPIIVVLDAFDEIPDRRKREELLALFVGSESGIADVANVKIVITSRNDKSLVNAIVAAGGTVIDHYENKNNDALKGVVEKFLSKCGYLDADSIYEDISAQSGGDLIYVGFILNEIEAKQPAQLSDLTFPLGMRGVCEKHFDRIFAGDMVYYRNIVAPVLEVMVSAKTPVGFVELQDICKIDPLTLNRLVIQLGMFVESRESAITFIHKSLRDWLESVEPGEKYYIDAAEGVRRLCSYVLCELMKETPSRYAAIFGLEHLFENGLFDDIADLMEQAPDTFNNVFLCFIEHIVSDGDAKRAITLFKHHSKGSYNNVFIVSETLKMLISYSMDSYVHKVLKLYSDSSGFDQLEQLVNFYTIKRGNESTEQLLELGEKLLVDIEDDKILADVSRVLADIHRESGNYDEAERLYREAMEEAELEDLVGVSSDCAFALADLLYVRGYLQEAQEALNDFESRSELDLQTPNINAYKYYRLRGHIRQIVEQDDAAINAYMRAYEIANDLNYRMKRMEAANSVAEAAPSHCEGIPYLEEARSIYRESGLNALEFGKSFYIESALYFDEGCYVNAEAAASRAIKILGGVHYAGGLAHSHLNRAKARYMLEEFDSAYDDLLLALAHYDGTSVRPRFRLETYYYLLLLHKEHGFPMPKFADGALSFFRKEDYPFLDREFVYVGEILRSLYV